MSPFGAGQPGERVSERRHCHCCEIPFEWSGPYADRFKGRRCRHCREHDETSAVDRGQHPHANVDGARQPRLSPRVGSSPSGAARPIQSGAGCTRRHAGCRPGVPVQTRTAPERTEDLTETPARGGDRSSRRSEPAQLEPACRSRFRSQSPKVLTESRHGSKLKST